jgi:hypothetical protein
VLGVAIGAAAPIIAATAEVVPGPGREVLVFDRFVGRSAPVCQYRPAAECVDMAWIFVDRNDDEGLSVEELQELRDSLKDWTVWRADQLSRTEGSLLALGFLVVDSLGVGGLHAIYDADHDGLVSRDELLADVRLDDRPLGEILVDRQSVDRAAIAARLGLPPGLVDRLQP